jgi:phosphatidylglycerophosphatase A
LRLVKERKIVDSSASIGFAANIFSSFFYTGYFPMASGTIASAAALVLFYFEIFRNPLILLMLILFCFVIGIYTSKAMMKRFGEDPSVVVIDEAVGMWITVLMFIVFSSADLTLFYAAACFFAFRFFDITKIQPAKHFDELNSGFGIMMDDVIAGIYAGAAVCVVALVA